MYNNLLYHNIDPSFNIQQSQVHYGQKGREAWILGAGPHGLLYNKTNVLTYIQI